MTSHCTGTVQMREESESGIRKWKRCDSRQWANQQKVEREGQQSRAMEDMSGCHRKLSVAVGTWNRQYFRLVCAMDRR